MPQLSLKRTFFGSVDTDVRRRRPVGRSAGTGPWGEVFLPEARHRGSDGAETPWEELMVSDFIQIQRVYISFQFIDNVLFHFHSISLI